MWIPPAHIRAKLTNPPPAPGQRIRAEDLKRAMVEDKPEEYRNESKFGTIPGIEVGMTWDTRDECVKAGVHTSTTAGISGGRNGASSIVMSGGYDDDDDKGDTIIYTGTGGYEDKQYGGGSSRSRGGSKQTADQSLQHSHNHALYMSYERAIPVRVIRGSKLNSKYSPSDGYRYDGLYRVKKVEMGKSRDGFQICRFTLEREPGQKPIPMRWN